jgi:hypothetical protein
MRVPVTTARRILRLRIEEWPPVWNVATNKLKKQSRTADKRWSSSLGVGRGANKKKKKKRILLRNIRAESLGPGQIILLRLGTGGGHL